MVIYSNLNQFVFYTILFTLNEDYLSDKFKTEWRLFWTAYDLYTQPQFGIGCICMRKTQEVQLRMQLYGRSYAIAYCVVFPVVFFGRASSNMLILLR